MSQTAEDVGNNIVKIVDSRGAFNGTGFFVEIKQNKYCITCHHCICKLAEIYIERDDTRCAAEWIEEFSDPNKDIAILKVNDCNIVKALKYAREAMAKLPVSVWGFSFKDLKIFPQGSPVENGTLSSASFPFHWPEENLGGTHEWNKKHQVKVYVFRFLGNFDVGFSGAPVCYEGNNNIIGVFTAKDNSYGYVIPIQTILEKFEDEKKKAADPSNMIDSIAIIDQGNEYFNKGDFVTAIDYYEKITNDPNYVKALFNKALALDNLERYDDAIAFYDKVLDIDHNDALTWYNKGDALDSLQRYDEAIKCYDEALKINSTDVNSLVNKGFSYYMLGKFDEAIKCYDSALRIDRTDVEAWNNKGYALYYLGEYGEAIKCYDEALKIDPNLPYIWRNKGVAFLELRKYKEAIKYIDKALAIDPDNVQALNDKSKAVSLLTRKEGYLQSLK